jgi:hypothetical protein
LRRLRRGGLLRYFFRWRLIWQEIRQDQRARRRNGCYLWNGSRGGSARRPDLRPGNGRLQFRWRRESRLKQPRLARRLRKRHPFTGYHQRMER